MSVWEAIKDLFNDGCVHDWHVVETVSPSSIELEALKKMDSHFVQRGFGFIDNNDPYVRKVCLRCGMKVDEITPAIDAELSRLVTAKRREQTAKEMWNK